MPDTHPKKLNLLNFFAFFLCFCFLLLFISASRSNTKLNKDLQIWKDKYRVANEYIETLENSLDSHDNTPNRNEYYEGYQDGQKDAARGHYPGDTPPEDQDVLFEDMEAVYYIGYENGYGDCLVDFDIVDLLNELEDSSPSISPEEMIRNKAHESASNLTDLIDGPETPNNEVFKSVLKDRLSGTPEN